MADYAVLARDCGAQDHRRLLRHDAGAPRGDARGAGDDAAGPGARPRHHRRAARAASPPPPTASAATRPGASAGAGGAEPRLTRRASPRMYPALVSLLPAASPSARPSSWCGAPARHRGRPRGEHPARGPPGHRLRASPWSSAGRSPLVAAASRASPRSSPCGALPRRPRYRGAGAELRHAVMARAVAAAAHGAFFGLAILLGTSIVPPGGAGWRWRSSSAGSTSPTSSACPRHCRRQRLRLARGLRHGRRDRLRRLRRPSPSSPRTRRGRPMPEQLRGAARRSAQRRRSSPPTPSSRCT